MYTVVPLLILFVLSSVTAIVFVLANRLLGPQAMTPSKLEPFECGIEVYGPVRQPLHVRFYLVALLFVLFDVESVFFFPWAVILKDLGLIAGVEMLAFLLFLVGALAYAWKKGALEWD